MKKASVQKKSGFAEGRAATGGPSRSGSGKKKERANLDTKVEKRITKKLDAAKSDLVDVLTKMNDVSEEGNEVYTTDEKGGVVSKFAKDYEQLRNNVLNSGDDFNADAAQRFLLKTMFNMLVDLIPVAEVNFRETKKEQAGYVLLGLVKQAEEMSSSLKMLGNVENQTQFIRDMIIHPLFTAMMSNFMSQAIGMKNSIETELPKSPKTARRLKLVVDEMLKAFGPFLDGSKTMLTSNISSYLAGDMGFLGEEKSKSTGGKKRQKG